MSNISRLYKKLHKWPALIIAFILLYYGVSGILMNHRELISGIDLSRKILPKKYHIENWTNGSIKSSLIINSDSIIVYGNIGIWVTDSSYQKYSSLNAGFKKGMDNRKIYDVHLTNDGNLYAATHFGLFSFDSEQNRWVQLSLDLKNKRFVSIESVGDTIYALNRSYLFTGISNGKSTSFSKIELPRDLNHKNEIGLFETTWQFHSGEIFGIPGKVYVDILGLITIFLSLTGIIYFFFPKWIKKRKKRNSGSKGIIKINKWSLKWHNYIGAWVFAFLVFLFFTGMFLRPPLLIGIANSRIKPIKYTHLDQPNPWYDKLRDLIYDEQKSTFLISTSEGMYYMSIDDLQPIKYSSQPPVSVMGINTFKKISQSEYMVGSFSGLFIWNPSASTTYNVLTRLPYEEDGNGRPIGDIKVSGTFTDSQGRLLLIDYDNGIIPLNDKEFKFPSMPENLLNVSGISLWNLALEFHTGRIFEPILGGFYVLIVPLTGLTAISVVLSGYLLWRNRAKRKHSNKSNQKR
jgi:hypothetical protein